MHLSGAWTLLIFVVVSVSAILFLLHLTQLGRLIHQEIPDRPRRRLFLAAVGFFVTFVAVRLLVASIEYRIGPFQYVVVGDHHIHHLVWGILILLLIGYGWLCEIDAGNSSQAIFFRRLLSLLYGVGAALTLDEFAMWLNLQAAYFSREGRASLDAIVLFGILLAIGVWGAPLFRVFRK